MKLATKDYLFVGIQFLLFIAYLFEIRLRTIHLPAGIILLGGLLSIAGVVVLILALLQLNQSLSPFPTPRSDAQLIRTGLYRYVRHPIYSGILFTVFGYGWYSASIYKLLIAAALLVLFYFKSAYEEERLMEAYPEYKDYKQSTGRFFLKLF